MSVFVSGFLVNDDGAVVLTPDAPSVDAYVYGKRMDSETEACYAEEGGDIFCVTNGLPLGIDGQLIVEEAGVPVFFEGVYGFTLEGRLCISSFPPVFYNKGLPFTAMGRLCAADLAPPPDPEARITTSSDPRVTSDTDPRILAET